MDELTVKSADLPALATEEVKQCVDLIGDAIQALKSKRNAAGHIGASKDVIDEMDAQIREYSAMKLKAEIELGKRTAAIKPASGVRSDLSQSVGEVTKAQALAEMGVSNQRASDYERMARHEDYVDQYIDRKLELGQTPTRHEVMREIKHYDRPDTLVEAAKKTVNKIQSAKIVDVEDLNALKSSQQVIANDTAETVYNKLLDATMVLYVYSSSRAKDVQTFCESGGQEKVDRLKKHLSTALGAMSRIMNELEGSN